MMVISKRGMAALFAGLLALAACEAPTPAATTRPGTAPNAGPGPQSVDPATAIRFFKAICLGTRPTFRNAPSVMAQEGMVRNQRTGTYYHPDFDLSVNVSAKGCSFVAGGDTFDAVDLATLVGSDPAGRAEPRLPSTFAGRTYISVLLPN